MKTEKLSFKKIEKYIYKIRSVKSKLKSGESGPRLKSRLKVGYRTCQGWSITSSNIIILLLFLPSKKKSQKNALF